MRGRLLDLEAVAVRHAADRPQDPAEAKEHHRLLLARQAAPPHGDLDRVEVVMKDLFLIIKN